MGINEYLKYVDFEEIDKKNEDNLMDEYISIELMCLSDVQYKYMFDFKLLKKVIISQEIGIINFSIKDMLIEKIEYLKEYEENTCSICLERLSSDKYNVCAKHLPSYCLFDTESESDTESERNTEIDIYPEYTKEELRELLYNEDSKNEYEDECYEI